MMVAQLYECICRSVASSCPTLYDPRDCSMPGFPVFTVSRSLLKHMSIDSLMPSSYLFLCHPLLLLPSVFPNESFPMSRLFTPGGQRIGPSVSTSVLPMNIQGWFPLGLTGLISLLSKGLLRVFFITTVEKHQLFPQVKSISSSTSAFFMVQLSHPSWLLENHSFDYMDLCWWSDMSAF